MCIGSMSMSMWQWSPFWSSTSMWWRMGNILCATKATQECIVLIIVARSSPDIISILSIVSVCYSRLVVFNMRDWQIFLDLSATFLWAPLSRLYYCGWLPGSRCGNAIDTVYVFASFPVTQSVILSTKLIVILYWKSDRQATISQNPA